MAVMHKMYVKGLLNMGGGDAAGDGPMDLLSDTMKLTLHTATYTPIQATDETKSQATNELGTSNGYTAGGATLASKVFSTSGLVATFDAADVTWTLTGAVTFRYGVIWDDTPTTPADPLLTYIDTGGDQTLNGVDLVFAWNVAGIFTLTAA